MLAAAVSTGLSCALGRKIVPFSLGGCSLALQGKPTFDFNFSATEFFCEYSEGKIKQVLP